MTTPTETTTKPAVTAAVEKAEKAPPGPRELIKQYSNDFATVLPTHIKADTWVRVAQGALKRGKRIDPNNPNSPYELEVAAANNSAAFLASLLDAAQLGLRPGTEEYYLTPRKVKGRLEILGIVGYQGYIELMYRAGATESVVAEVVYSNDKFAYQPGVDEVPRHEIDWDADDRGTLRLVYAYARMKGGATSKVIVLNRAAIAEIKKSAQGADSDYSPWKTNEPAMWLKSAVRQLRKWVPTSAEYIGQRVKLAAEAAAQAQKITVEQLDRVDPDTGEILDGEYEDAP